jgi:hypothetical protein
MTLAGCVAAPKDVPVSSTYSHDEMKFIQSTGKASITGQAFMRQRGGGVVTAAGEEILLIPDTAYTREVTDKMLSGQTQLAAGSNLKSYTRKTIADAEGRFKFNGLVGGSYIALAVVRWEIPGEYGSRAQGGGLKQEVTVADGQTAEIIMSK